MSKCAIRTCIRRMLPEPRPPCHGPPGLLQLCFPLPLHPHPQRLTPSPPPEHTGYGKCVLLRAIGPPRGSKIATSLLSSALSLKINTEKSEKILQHPSRFRFNGLFHRLSISITSFPCRTPASVSIRRLCPFSVGSFCFRCLGYSWLTRKDPSIDWVTQEIRFQTPVQKKSACRHSVDFRVHFPRAEFHTPQPSAADSQSDSQSPSLGPFAALRATAAKISISVINAHATGLLGCLPCCHPSFITYPASFGPRALPPDPPMFPPISPPIPP